MRISNLISPPKLEQVFTPGGQPSVTYVDRAHLGLEAALKKAVRQRSIIVSLTGATKSGKTVLCRNVMNEYEFVWVDGGAVKTEADIWDKICAELNIPAELHESEGRQTGGGIQAGVEAEAGAVVAKKKFALTISGSRLKSFDQSRTYRLNSMHAALEHMLENGIALVVDDFHYIDEAVRGSLIKTLKGAVFRGLKVILLSTPHRAFEAIKAEAEITGRFKHVTVPDWSKADLRLIATTGFDALNVDCPPAVIGRFAGEAEGSPLLMQQFCWNLCYDSEIEEAPVTKATIAANFDPTPIFAEVAADAGLPIYEKLKKGPQTRTERIMRPLVNGGSVDIYQAILLAIASTGPKERLSYDQIRGSLNSILAEKVPQKIEVSNALNHLAAIDRDENSARRAIDWNAEDLELVIVDPFLRFYLRWEVAKKQAAASLS